MKPKVKSKARAREVIKRNYIMEVIYNLTDRKPFVKALEEITGAKAVYMRTPTYAYRVDYFTVTCEGNLTFDDMKVVVNSTNNK